MKIERTGMGACNTPIPDLDLLDPHVGLDPINNERVLDRPSLTGDFRSGSAILSRWHGCCW